MCSKCVFAFLVCFQHATDWALLVKNVLLLFCSTKRKLRRQPLSYIVLYSYSLHVLSLKCTQIILLLEFDATTSFSLGKRTSAPWFQWCAVSGLLRWVTPGQQLFQQRSQDLFHIWFRWCCHRMPIWCCEGCCVVMRNRVKEGARETSWGHTGVDSLTSTAHFLSCDSILSAWFVLWWWLFIVFGLWRHGSLNRFPACPASGGLFKIVKISRHALRKRMHMCGQKYSFRRIYDRNAI